jgi:hypothetical protein
MTGTRCSPACSTGLEPLSVWDLARRSRHRSEQLVPLSLLHRCLPRYPFSSFFSALRKRQSVPWAMIFWGLLLIIPISCRRRA